MMATQPYSYDRRTAAGGELAPWEKEMIQEAEKAKAAAEKAHAAAEDARKAINVLVHTASKHKLNGTPFVRPIGALDTMLHKKEGPSGLFEKAVQDLSALETKLKARD